MMITDFVAHNVGGSASEIAMRAKALIAQNVISQAFVQGINDDFLAGAFFTIIILIPVFLLKFKKKSKKEKIEVME